MDKENSGKNFFKEQLRLNKILEEQKEKLRN